MSDQKKSNLALAMWASSVSDEEREENDYYATEICTIQDLIKLNFLNKNILEPCCWEWHISKELIKAWHNVHSQDLIDRWYWIWWKDFLESTWIFEWDIVTNPPYKLAKEFVLKALECINEWNHVVMLLKVQFFESEKRKELFDKSPPKIVYMYRKRQVCWKWWEFYHKDGKKKWSAVFYCRFVWEKWFSWDPIIKWI